MVTMTWGAFTTLPSRSTIGQPGGIANSRTIGWTVRTLVRPTGRTIGQPGNRQVELLLVGLLVGRLDPYW